MPNLVALWAPPRCFCGQGGTAGRPHHRNREMCSTGALRSKAVSSYLWLYLCKKCPYTPRSAQLHPLVTDRCDHRHILMIPQGINVPDGPSLGRSHQVRRSSMKRNILFRQVVEASSAIALFLSISSPETGPRGAAGPAHSPPHGNEKARGTAIRCGTGAVDADAAGGKWLSDGHQARPLPVVGAEQRHPRPQSLHSFG